MNTHHRTHDQSFVIRVETPTTCTTQTLQHSHKYISPKLNFSTMKLCNRFRKLLMRLIFSLPSRGSSSSSATTATPRQRNGDRSIFEPPKTSCSSYYSSHSHYNEAIADCIEFFNKSSQEGICFEGRKSDVLV